MERFADLSAYLLGCTTLEEGIACSDGGQGWKGHECCVDQRTRVVNEIRPDKVVT
jgi:hypothetical protein